MRVTTAAIALVLSLVCPVTCAAAAADTASTSTAKMVGNKHCPIMTDEDVNANSKTVTHKGYAVSVCCKRCVKKFATDPDKYLKAALEDAAKK